MQILAFDTSTHVGSMALLSQGELIAERSVTVRASHGEALLPELVELLRQCGAHLRDVDLFAVGIGPGAFTGVRIGVATAKGLALAERKPLVGVTSLQVLARGAGVGSGYSVPIVDAYKGEVYAAVYQHDGTAQGDLLEVVAPFHATPEVSAARIRASCGAEPLWWFGSAGGRYGDSLSRLLGPTARRCPAFCGIPRAACLAHEAARSFAVRGPDDSATLEPLYVRPSDAKLKTA